MSGRLEKLFSRYRERGDAAALAEVFDQTAPELFRLAQHLVRDALAAEDVLQDTFVSAIDAAPRWDASRPLVPWLTGILARKASESRRRARREVDPARLDERGERDPAVAAEGEEFSRELRAALASLPELYREVLERHLLEGARPAEIARDLERSPGAVRMQLLRGLEQLRRALPAGFAAGAALALFAPRGLAAVREVVLAHAVSQGAVLAAAGGAAAASSALAWPVGLGAALVLSLAAGGWIWSALGGGAPRDVEPARPDAPVALAPVATSLSPEGGAATIRAQAEPAAIAASTQRVLRGVVRGPEGAALREVELALRGIARYAWPQDWTLRARPGEDGAFAIALDELLASARRRGGLDALELEVDHPAFLPERLRIDAGSARAELAGAREIELWVEVALRPALVLEGRVERPGDGPAPEVGALPVVDGALQERWLDRAVAGADGEFRLRLPAVGEVEVVACAADALADRERLWVGPGGAVLPRALRLAAGVRLEGRLELPGLEGEIESVRLNAPSEGATPPQVELAGRPLSLRDGIWRVASSVAEVAPDGSFTLVGLEALGHRLTPRARRGLVLYPLSAFERECALAQPLERQDFEIAAARLDVRMRDGSGAPVAGAFQVGVGAWFADLATHLDGTRALALPPDSEPQLWVTQDPGGPRSLPRLARAERREVTLAVASSPKVPRLVLELDVAGDVPSTLAVALRRPGEAEPFEVRTFEGVGRALELDAPPAEPFELEVHVGGAHRHLEDGWLPARLSVPESGARLARVSITLERGARLRLVARDNAGRSLPLAARVLDLWGAEVPVRFLRRGSDEQGFTAAGRLSDLGPVDVVPNLAPGLWTVEVAGADGAVRRRHVRLELGDEVELEFAP